MDELQTAAAQFLPKKMAEFSNELITKDDVKLQELRILATELELRGGRLTYSSRRLRVCCPGKVNVAMLYVFVGYRYPNKNVVA